MEEAMDKKLITVKLDEVLDHPLHVNVVADNLVDFGYPEALKKLHDQNPRRCRLSIDLRNDNDVACAKQFPEPLDVVGLMLKIHFFGNHSRKFFDDRAGSSYRVVVDELLDDEKQVLNDTDVRRDQLFNARPQDLNNDVLAAKSRPMHLSKRGGRQRFLMEFFEHRFQRPFQFRMNAFSNFTGWKRRHLIVQLGQFFQIDVWNDVGPNSEDLGQLDETRAERRDARRQPPR